MSETEHLLPWQIREREIEALIGATPADEAGRAERVRGLREALRGSISARQVEPVREALARAMAEGGGRTVILDEIRQSHETSMLRLGPQVLAALGDAAEDAEGWARWLHARLAETTPSPLRHLLERLLMRQLGHLPPAVAATLLPSLQALQNLTVWGLSSPQALRAAASCPGGEGLLVSAMLWHDEPLRTAWYGAGPLDDDSVARAAALAPEMTAALLRVIVRAGWTPGPALRLRLLQHPDREVRALVGRTLHRRESEQGRGR